MLKKYISVLVFLFCISCSNKEKTIILNHSEEIFNSYIYSEIANLTVQSLLESSQLGFDEVSANIRDNNYYFSAQMNGNRGFRKRVLQDLVDKEKKVLDGLIDQSLLEFKEDSLYLNPFYSRLKTECLLDSITISPMIEDKSNLKKYKLGFKNLDFIVIEDEKMKISKLVPLQNERDIIDIKWRYNRFILEIKTIVESNNSDE